MHSTYNIRMYNICAYNDYIYLLGSFSHLEKAAMQNNKTFFYYKTRSIKQNIKHPLGLQAVKIVKVKVKVTKCRCYRHYQVYICILIPLNITYRTL